MSRLSQGVTDTTPCVCYKAIHHHLFQLITSPKSFLKTPIHESIKATISRPWTRYHQALWDMNGKKLSRLSPSAANCDYASASASDPLRRWPRSTSILDYTISSDSINGTIESTIIIAAITASAFIIDGPCTSYRRHASVSPPSHRLQCLPILHHRFLILNVPLFSDIRHLRVSLALLPTTHIN